MNQPLPVSWPDRSSGPRPVPGRSVWPAPALLENHPRSRLCATAAGGDRPRSESDRFMVPMHARSERGLPMSRDSQTRMTNDEIRMTKPATAQLRAFGHSGFGFLSSFVIRHSSFNDLFKSGAWSPAEARCARRHHGKITNVLALAGPLRARYLFSAPTENSPGARDLSRRNAGKADPRLEISRPRR